MSADINKYELKQAQQALPSRGKADNKTAGGKALILAGSHNLWGAAVLSAKACARMGAGYTYLHSSDSNFPISDNPDFLYQESLSENHLSQFKAVAIGPGLQDENFIQSWIRKLYNANFKNVVLDAEALNTLAKSDSLKVSGSWVLTPHEGELSRLIDKPSDWIRANRIQAARLTQAKYGAIILLKGHNTLIVDSLKAYQIESGNAALAKAGTGDVLTGFIVALLSQGLEPINAACLAAYIHGKIADDWLKDKKDQLSLMASDLIEQLPKSLYELRNTQPTASGLATDPQRG